MRTLGIAAAALVLALPASAASAATPDPLWSVRVAASGDYALDYGREGDQIDGHGTGAWNWQMKAVAAGLKVDTETAIFRMHVEESSDIVVTPSTAHCRPPGVADLGWVRDSRVGMYLSTSVRTGNGFQINHPFFDLVGGCHAGAHGMSLYDGASPADTRLPRGAFSPRRARTFARTWTQAISLDATHESGVPHTFLANGTITVRLKRIGKRAARTLEARLRAVPRASR